MLRAPFVLLYNLFSFLRYLWSSFWFKLGYFFRRKKKLYLVLKLESHYAFGPKTGLMSLFQKKPSFLELRKWLQRAADDETVDGLVVVSEPMAMGYGRIADLTHQIDEVREAGKHVVGHAQMPLLRDYTLLTAADDILASPSGRLYTFGPRFDQYFGREALEKLGVVPQFIHIGQFKAAAHRFIHSESTSPQRTMMRALYDGLEENTRQRVAERRGLTDEEVEVLFAEAPLDTGRALSGGFVDARAFREGISDWLRAPEKSAPIGYLGADCAPAADKSAEGEAPPPEGDDDDRDRAGAPAPPEVPDDEHLMVGLENHVKSAPTPFEWKPLFRPRKRFAVLDLSGMIVMPNMSLPAQGSVVIDPSEVVPALRHVRDNPVYAGAILHIDSPGGSALASDIIWHAIERLRRVKPVVAQCSNVAGSGGYYLAVGADEIVCQPQTLIGSIGVITGKMSAPDIPEKVGIHAEAIYERDADTFTSLLHPLSDEMMEQMNDDARDFYRRFLQRVGQARQLPRRRLHRYARGRVYLGDGACRRRLADHLGGLEVALERLGALTERDPERTKLGYVGHRKESLKSALTGSIQASMPEWLDEMMQPALVAALLKRDPVLALMPFDLS
ncbi:MAG: S49 family peptidase [Persicimonas sp.]